MKISKSKMSNDLGHQKCCCYDINYLGATNTAINTPKWTAPNCNKNMSYRNSYFGLINRGGGGGGGGIHNRDFHC